MKNRNEVKGVKKKAVKQGKYFDMHEKKESPTEVFRRIKEGNEKNRLLRTSFASTATETNTKAVALVTSFHRAGFTFRMKRDGLRFDVVRIQKEE